ncbi:MAG: hypothetical protein HQL65_07840 [Magnetococcales bacterium]|nr:hypothetical protein [Magnetococcales bacterium]
MKTPTGTSTRPPQTTIGTEEYLDRLTSYDVNDNPEYIGLAQPGGLTSDGIWQIRKISYTDGNPVSARFANGNAEFDKVWDDRSAYSY